MQFALFNVTCLSHGSCITHQVTGGLACDQDQSYCLDEDHEAEMHWHDFNEISYVTMKAFYLFTFLSASSSCM